MYFQGSPTTLVGLKTYHHQNQHFVGCTLYLQQHLLLFWECHDRLKTPQKPIHPSVQHGDIQSESVVLTRMVIWWENNLKMLLANDMTGWHGLTVFDFKTFCLKLLHGLCEGVLYIKMHVTLQERALFDHPEPEELLCLLENIHPFGWIKLKLSRFSITLFQIALYAFFGGLLWGIRLQFIIFALYWLFLWLWIRDNFFAIWVQNAPGPSSVMGSWLMKVVCRRGFWCMIPLLVVQHSIICLIFIIWNISIWH